MLAVGATVAVAGAGLFLASPPAQAAGQVDTYLGGLGIYTSSCPVTPTNVVYVQPGTTLRFHADATGLGAVTGFSIASLQTTFTNPLNAQQSIAVGAGTPAPGTADIGFPNQGTFNFSWTSTLTAVNLLGVTVQTAPIATATGAQAGWSAQIVVSTRQQGCTLAPQLPSVSVQPNLPVVGQLPKVSLPGVQLPGVAVPGVPGVSGLPGLPTVPGIGLPTAGSGAAGNRFTYTGAPTCTGPCLVVPKGGSGGGGVAGNAYDRTLDADTAGGGSGSSAGSAGPGGRSGVDAARAGNGVASPAAAAFDLAGPGATESGLHAPTVLTVVAGLALAGGTLAYSRRLTRR